MWIYTPKSRGHILRRANQVAGRRSFWQLRRFTHQEYWHLVQIIIFLVLLWMGVRLGSVVFSSMMEPRGAFYVDRVRLPHAASARKIPRKRHLLYIRGAPRNRILPLERGPLKPGEIGVPAPFRVLGNWHRRPEQPAVLIIDREIPMSMVHQLMDTLRAQGISQVAFLTAFETDSRKRE